MKISTTKAKVTYWMDVVIEPSAEVHSCQIRWKAAKEDAPPEFLKELAGTARIKRIDWKPTIQSS